MRTGNQSCYQLGLSTCQHLKCGANDYISSQIIYHQSTGLFEPGVDMGHISYRDQDQAKPWARRISPLKV